MFFRICIILGLTNMEIFEKDLKMVSGPSMNIAMTSVTMDMQVGSKLTTFTICNNFSRL